MARPDFGRLATSYDRIRPVDDNWRELFDVLVAEADLRGRRVLDVGCGTGRLCTELTERGIARAWGVDASAEMVAVAKANVPGAGFKHGEAERLPFKDAWFDRAVMWLSSHLVDRHRAFAEIRRTLTPGGILGVVTFDPAHFDAFWLNRFFPAMEAIDRARFPDAAALDRELRTAGFGHVRTHRRHQAGTLTRERALDWIRNRHISTFDLLTEEEIREGTTRAERELPEQIEYALEWLLVVAETMSSP
jgi:SAM-dependent methyltransferase